MMSITCCNVSMVVPAASLMDVPPFLEPESNRCVAPLGVSGQSLGFSSRLFSWGLIVDRTTMTLFSISNQKGAPSETAQAVTSHPSTDQDAKSAQNLYCSHWPLPWSEAGCQSTFQPMGKPFPDIRIKSAFLLNVFDGMASEISLRCRDQGISLCFVDPKLVGDRNRTHVHHPGNRKAQPKNNDLGTALTPTGDPVHGAVEPVLNTLSEFFHVVPGEVQHRCEGIFDFCVFDFPNRIEEIDCRPSCGTVRHQNPEHCQSEVAGWYIGR